MSTPHLLLREATPIDIPAVADLILEHGPNDWNYLPEDDVRSHVKGFSDGSTHGMVAEADGNLVGVVTYEIGQFYPHYQPPGREQVPHGYIAEAAIHREYVGKGIGTILCGKAIERMAGKGIKEIYAMRHADNVPSGRMMEKNNMEIIDEFDDPGRRPTGSGLTTVTRLILPESIIPDL